MVKSKKGKINSTQLLDKRIVSKTGKHLGELKDLVFESRTGEIINIVMKNNTDHAASLDLEKSSKGGELLIPFNAVVAVGDLIVVAEEDLI